LWCLGRRSCLRRERRGRRSSLFVVARGLPMSSGTRSRAESSGKRQWWWLQRKGGLDTRGRRRKGKRDGRWRCVAQASTTMFVRESVRRAPVDLPPPFTLTSTGLSGLRFHCCHRDLYCFEQQIPLSYTWCALNHVSFQISGISGPSGDQQRLARVNHPHSGWIRFRCYDRDGDNRMTPGALWLSHVYDVPGECLESLSKSGGLENSPIRHTLRIFGLDFKHLVHQRIVSCSLLGCRPNNINYLIFFASLQLHFSITPVLRSSQASFSQGHQGEYVVSLLIFRQASNIF